MKKSAAFFRYLEEGIAYCRCSKDIAAEMTAETNSYPSGVNSLFGNIQCKPYHNESEGVVIVRRLLMGTQAD